MHFTSLSKLLVLASTVGSSLGAITLNVKDTAAIKTAAKTASAWLGYYYQSWGDGAWDQNILHWHESGMYWQTYLEYRKYFADNGNSGIQNTLQGKWNDDILWWALAAVTGSEIFGPDATFAQVMDQWDTTTCNGGIYWSRDRNSGSKNYKCTDFTKEAYYKDTADMLYKWMKQYVIQSDYLIMDGIDALTPGDTADSCGKPTPNPWSYQHGALIPGLAVLYNITGEASYIDEAHAHFERAYSFFVDEKNIIHDPICRQNYVDLCNKDPGGFAWALYRGFATLYTITPSATVRSKIEAALEATLLEDIKKCPGTNADWELFPKKYTFDNGTNPRDQVETMELLTALGVIRGFKPVDKTALPAAPAPPPPAATTPPKSSAGSLRSSAGYVAMMAVAALFIL
ncbi:glycosyl hydrolase family 76-domain-containing protein [Chytridium lagenaria]|nr:glycosyl hydrolase family 76-domain-containing protein [Chytridium lagenaria]